MWCTTCNKTTHNAETCWNTFPHMKQEYHRFVNNQKQAAAKSQPPKGYTPKPRGLVLHISPAWQEADAPSDQTRAALARAAGVASSQSTDVIDKGNASVQGPLVKNTTAQFVVSFIVSGAPSVQVKSAQLLGTAQVPSSLEAFSKAHYVPSVMILGASPVQVKPAQVEVQGPLGENITAQSLASVIASEAPSLPQVLPGHRSIRSYFAPIGIKSSTTPVPSSSSNKSASKPAFSSTLSEVEHRTSLPIGSKRVNSEVEVVGSQKRVCGVESLILHIDLLADYRVRATISISHHQKPRLITRYGSVHSKEDISLSEAASSTVLNLRNDPID